MKLLSPHARFNIAFFVVGTALFVYLVQQFGLDRIEENIRRAGVSLVYIIVIWFFIYLLNTTAWNLILRRSGNRISFARLFMVTVSGFSINTITPVLAVGGEPYRVKMLSEPFGTRASLSAVVLYRMVYFFGHMLSILAGIACGVILLDLPAPLRLFLLAVFAVIGAAVVWALSVHKSGLFEPIMNVLRRFRLLRRVSAALEKRRDALMEMDSALTDVYSNERGRFYATVLLEFATRVLMAVEIYVILHSIGFEISIPSALFVYALYSVIINLFFFIPLNLGVREGGLMLGLQSLAATPMLGIYLGVVIRLRDFFWIIVGLIMILFTGRTKAPANERKGAAMHAGRIDIQHLAPGLGREGKERA
jgi:uncharacterized protein (TIRG00374 family)